jgi:hypothetical protein
VFAEPRSSRALSISFRLPQASAACLQQGLLFPCAGSCKLLTQLGCFNLSLHGRAGTRVQIKLE